MVLFKKWANLILFYYIFRGIKYRGLTELILKTDIKFVIAHTRTARICNSRCK